MESMVKKRCFNRPPNWIMERGPQDREGTQREEREKGGKKR